MLQRVDFAFTMGAASGRCRRVVGGEGADGEGAVPAPPLANRRPTAAAAPRLSTAAAGACSLQACVQCTFSLELCSG